MLAATAALALLLWQWRPIAEPVLWSVSDPAPHSALHAVFWLGWGVLLTSTFLINHFALFGLRQVWANPSRPCAAGARVPHAAVLPPRPAPDPSRRGAHLLGDTPDDRRHLLIAAACTAYVLVGAWFAERDLIAQFGPRYHQYRKQGGMLVPRLGARDRKGPAQS